MATSSPERPNEGDARAFASRGTRRLGISPRTRSRRPAGAAGAAYRRLPRRLPPRSRARHKKHRPAHYSRAWPTCACSKSQTVRSAVGRRGSTTSSSPPSLETWGHGRRRRSSRPAQTWSLPATSGAWYRSQPTWHEPERRGACSTRCRCLTRRIGCVRLTEAYPGQAVSASESVNDSGGRARTTGCRPVWLEAESSSAPAPNHLA